ncbi:PepSY domain-containing protein [Neotabrizicola shimadae]|nr:PepSY domain-containing protein [Neotabrizicola shimadae]
MDRPQGAGQVAAIRGAVPRQKEGKTMKRILTLFLFLTAAPLAALAAPAVGDVVGTTPEAATAALAEKGCKVSDFEAEDGKIEAKCTDEAGKPMEVYIDPASGAVTEVKSGD